ncbi:hypothetical protein BKA67DRAFT_556960 [Truncatella angustata]|uniref:Uncharacterized protein n=1 Tax=Truncatella angustata TaxID=152316 RepID=A0A9P8UT55_9PEZI|nr:uncharacterized protein BKA67DRAFT_556960 [Truncatella angustata]KAH6658017.1 hypothetical protein BKA67DRAFT_556960 [Truncatella angustata]KAH8196124.1 hypothetical protein TruAng_009723 [Truncatella angustata]
MAAIAKTIVATGASSGLGFEAIKQLLQQSQSYTFLLGARDITRTQAAYDSLKIDTAKHSVSLLPLDLSNLRAVKSFAQQALDKLGENKLDVLFLNAGMAKAADEPGPHGSKWCESYVVNHLSQHYLIHLLRDKLAASQSRIIVVSSGAIRSLRDNNPETLDGDLLANSGTDGAVVYSASKFTQLLGAHYWRRQFGKSTRVIAVSPGLIPNTGIGRNSKIKIPTDHPDAKSVEEGAQNLLRAITIEDFPDDPEQIFLTSWGEWWPKDVYTSSLDKALQDKWCPGKEEIEKDARISL